MSKKTISLLLCSLVVFLNVLTGGYQVSAAEEGNGGQAAVESKITFYEDSSTATSESETLPITSQVKSSILGKLPQTGEEIAKIGVIGIFILSILLFLFFYKRRKNKEKQENEVDTL